MLLVEDDAMLRRLVAGALARRGWHVVQAGSAEAAIEHLGEASPADIGALVADLSLPGQPGDRLGLEVRARLGRPCLPVILVSGFPAANGGAAADSAMGFLAKPYATNDLAALIAALVRAEALERDPGVGPIR